MKKTIAIIGEGITEKYYIESLKSLSNFSILPRELNRKASSLTKLAQEIKNGIDKGYDKIYCLIDMDNKDSGKEQTSYQNFKEKYSGIHEKKSKGISCEVKFIETERCLELWFLFYFLKNNTTRKFNSYKEIEIELRKYRPNYEKTEKYFRSIKDIHLNFINSNPKGSLEIATTNSRKSIITRDKDTRNYTYSEMHLLLEDLNIIEEKDKK